MSAPKITIVASDYFEGFFFKILGGLLVGAALFSIIKATYWLGLLLSLIAVFIFTTQYKLKIDLGEKYFFEYLWLLGFKKGEKVSFQNLNEALVKPERYSQRINSFATQKVIHFTVYAIYIRVDQDNQLFAGESKDKDKASQKAREIANRLGINARILN